MLVSLAAARSFVAAGEDLLREGQSSKQVRIVLSGWACRYHALPDGGQQITGFLLPGDFCNLPSGFAGESDHAVRALTAVTVAEVPRGALNALAAERPAISRAIWQSTLIEQAILRRWIVNLGALSAVQRVAHLFCELWSRLHALGLVDGPTFSLPLTQVNLAETCGLSPVHMNRVLQQLREDRLIELSRRSLTIIDPPRLQETAGFQADYLHLRRS